MNPMDYFAKCMEKYAVFRGRASRSEFWWFTLFNFLIHVAVSAVAAGFFDEAMFVISNFVFALVLFLPQLAVSVRRLHDSGKSGWFMLFMLFPPAMIVLLIFWLLRSTPVTNQWGPPPYKYDSSDYDNDARDDEDEFLEDFGIRDSPIRRGRDRRY